MMNTQPFKIDLSLIAIPICAIIWYFNFLYVDVEGRKLIHDDVINYYSYLPAIFIQHDAALSFLDTANSELPANAYWHVEDSEGHRYFKMSMGVALLYSPWFFIGHVASLRSHSYKADGFTLHYEGWLAFGTFVYGILAFLLLRKVLRRYFSPAITGATLLVLGLGTNLYTYIVYETLMSHVYSFFCFSALLFFVLRYFERPGIRDAIFSGITLGFISLIRPTNAIACLVFLLIGVNSASGMMERVRFFMRNRMHTLSIIFSALVIWIPQLVYWRSVTGHYFVYSYTEEGFFFLKPHLWEVLFGFRKGFFVYAPLMLLSIAGMFLLRKRLPGWSWLLPIFFLLNTYIISSWWCWWYGGSHGLRPMIDSYPLLAIAMAACLERLNALVSRFSLLVASVIIFMIGLNVFQSWQYSTSLLHYDSMNFETYRKIFLKNRWFNGYEYSISPPDYEHALQGLPERDLRKQNPS